MNSITRHILFIIATLAIISTVIAQEIPDWYEVSQWEIEVCSKWGGSELVQAGATTAKPISLSQLTLTMQAEGIYFDDFNIPNSSVENLYTVSWYIQPVAGEIEYNIVLVTSDGSTAPLTSGKASYQSAGFGHEALYHPSIFTRARMNFGDNALELPIVTK
jgi:hypothetical protein